MNKHLTQTPDIDSPEGRRFLLAARAAQARLLIEVMDLHNDELDDEEQGAVNAMQNACEWLGDVARAGDWSNESGE